MNNVRTSTSLARSKSRKIIKSSTPDYEEKVLEERLEGYRIYKQKVKYKVIPFIR